MSPEIRRSNREGPSARAPRAVNDRVNLTRRRRTRRTNRLDRTVPPANGVLYFACLNRRFPRCYRGTRVGAHSMTVRLIRLAPGHSPRADY